MGAAIPDGLLEGIALERARTIAPFVLMGVTVAFAVSEILGIPLALPVILWNLFAITALLALTIALRRRSIPRRWGHLALTAGWVLPAIGTLLSGASTDMARVAPVLLLEMSCAAILLQTRVVVALLLALDVACVAIVSGLETQALGLYALTVFLAQILTVVFQRMHRDSIVRAEEHRHRQHEAALALAAQLEQLQRSEAARDALHEQLVHAQRMEATGTLAAGLAHDMNNILASITGVASLLREDIDDKKAHADLDCIISQASRGGELTRGLLAFSRRGQYRRQRVSLDGVVRDVVAILSRTLPKSITVRSRPATEPLWVEGDPTQLQQVIINLAMNAADAMSGRGDLEIETARVELAGDSAAQRSLAPGAYARLLVRDNGCGMDELTRRRVFEPFFTTKPQGRGTGLGLATVWGITQAHGGTAEVRSEVGQGTTFTIHIPISQARPEVIAPREVACVARRATILVVDDETAVRESTMRLLRRRGFEVIGAENGAAALELYRGNEHVIGLVILDMAMPVMGGAECFHALRTASDVPVLIATGYASDADAQQLTSEGASLIEKPFSAAQLLDEVARLIPAPKAACA